MSREKSDNVFQLVKSLTRSEKRYFKLFAAQQDKKNVDKKFVRLFDIIDEIEDYNEEVILKFEPSFIPSQLPNLKAHLYTKVLQSLRQYERGKLADIEIREMIDYAELLFNRSMYEQCVDILKKARKKAEKNDNLELLLEIYRWDKNVLSMTLGKNNQARVNKILQGVQETSNRINNITRFTNLAVKLNAQFLKLGYVKNEHDYQHIKQLLEQEMIPYNEENLSFTEKIHLYDLYVSFYSFAQDIEQAYVYAQKWVRLFDKKSRSTVSRVDMYIKALNNLMIAQYKLGMYSEFVKSKNDLKDLNRLPASLLNDNIRLKLFKYTYVHEFNRLFMLGHFEEGVDRFNRIKHNIDVFIEKLDKHSRVILFFKIACLYFGNSNFRDAVYWLNRIINTQELENDVRKDIHGFARIISLICHYEMDNTDIMEYYIRSTYRFLSQDGNLFLVQKYILQFLKGLNKETTGQELLMKFKQLRDKLLPLEEDLYEKRPFIYFDIISWLDSKIENRPVQEIIQGKAKMILDEGAT